MRMIAHRSGRDDARKWLQDCLGTRTTSEHFWPAPRRRCSRWFQPSGGATTTGTGGRNAKVVSRLCCSPSLKVRRPPIWPLGRSLARRASRCFRPGRR
jgi:hypothetical protein